MHVNFIKGDANDKSKEACYAYLISKYGGVVRDRHIRQGVNGGASQERLLIELSGSRREEESWD